jgi:hypothetical protein
MSDKIEDKNMAPVDPDPGHQVYAPGEEPYRAPAVGNAEDGSDRGGDPREGSTHPSNTPDRDPALTGAETDKAMAAAQAAGALNAVSKQTVTPQVVAPNTVEAAKAGAPDAESIAAMGVDERGEARTATGDIVASAGDEKSAEEAEQESISTAMIGTAEQVAKHAGAAAIDALEDGASSAVYRLLRFLHLMPPMSTITREDGGAFSVQVRGQGMPRHGARFTLLHAFEEAHGVDVDQKYKPEPKDDSAQNTEA